ncbi:hypothetical protein ACFQ0B_53215 [Nonomuraea thailandensis]
MKETRKRTFTCGLDAAIAVMGGKWKGLILFALQDGPCASVSCGARSPASASGC